MRAGRAHSRDDGRNQAMDPTNDRSFDVGASQVTVGRFTYGVEPRNIRQWGEGAGLTIGSFCSVARGVRFVLGGNHRADWITTFPFGHIHRKALGGTDVTGHPATKGDVTIGHDVWIGEDVTILSGVTIGNGAVLAANSTVAKDVGDYEIWGGNPAKFLKHRFDTDTIERLCRLQWWDLEIEVIKRLIPDLSAAPTPEQLDRIERQVAESRS